MKLSALIFLSIDGVYQGPGRPDEDERFGFDRGGWMAAIDDDEMGEFIFSMYQRADALLLGRVTWDIWLPFWPVHDDHPIGHLINALPKYVPSTTLKDPTWHNTHVIAGDLEAAVRELKAKSGRELQIHGSGALMGWLLEHDLIDELNLMTVPVVVGEGLRFFPEHGPTHALTLLKSHTTPAGVTIQTFHPEGRASFAAEGAEDA